MTQENLICIGVGMLIGAVGFPLVAFLWAKIRAYRLGKLPRGTVLFRP